MPVATRPAYTPQGSIVDLWRCRAMEVLCHGPTRSGKTRGQLEKMLLGAMKYPGSRMLLIRKTRASMSESILQTFEDHVLPARCPWRGIARRDYRRSYVLPNGSEIVVAGIDTPDRIMSTEYDRIFVFEATELREDEYEQITTRLSGTATAYRQITADCNPTTPTHWLYRRMKEGRMVEVASTHKDNPRFWDAAAGAWTPDGLAYRAMLDASLSGHRKARLLEGRWVSAEGIVYPEFEPARHVLTTMPDGWQTWRKYRSIDLGFSNPFVCQWWAVDGDGRMYLYREIYRTGITVDVHAEEVKRLSAGETYAATVCDHDAGERAILERTGIPTVKANKSVRAGIDAVRGRLLAAADGRPRIFFLASALTQTDRTLSDSSRPTCTLSEFDSYAYPAHTSLKEEPVKEHDHGMDAMRYAVMHLDAKPLLIPYVGRVGGRGGV